MKAFSTVLCFALLFPVGAAAQYNSNSEIQRRQRIEMENLRQQLEYEQMQRQRLEIERLEQEQRARQYRQYQSPCYDWQSISCSGKQREVR